MARPISELADLRARLLAGMLARDAYSRRLRGDVVTVLEAAYRAIAEDITASPAIAAADAQRQLALFRRIRQLLEAAYGDAARLTARALPALAQVEAVAAGAELRALALELGGDVASVERIAPVLSAEKARAIATFPIEGLPLGDWWQAQANAMSLVTRRSLQAGLLKGETPQELVARIIPPRASVKPAVWRQARAQAAAVVRTSTNMVHAQANVAVYESAGAGVSREYEYLSARDSRVSKICAALDGRRFRYDDPARKMPPQHIGCRSTILPVLNYKALGLEEPDPRALTLPSLDSWLRRQPASTQREILGATRAKWYADGRMSLRQLIDEDDRVLTLEQLAERLGTAADVPARKPAARTPAKPAIARSQPSS